MAGEHSPPGRRLFCSCSYQNPFIRDAAQRLNLIARLALTDFEAARFMRDLRRAILEGEREPPKGA